MKLLRHGTQGAEKPGMLDTEGTPRDLSGAVHDIGGDTLLDAGLDALRGIDPATLPRVAADTRLGPCVAPVGKLIGIGLNYSDHAAEANAKVPEEPILFMKATSAICGPNDDVVIPKGSTRTDWEVELGVVIGRTASHVEKADALDHVAGYCIVNDVSERAYQIERGGQWVKGKSCDTFGPLGPWLVTRDEVPDPQALAMWLEVDGTRRQDASTALMIFGVAELVSYCSQFMTLNPGDVIATGTPAGVGMGKGTYLSAGQTMRLAIAGLGEQQQRTVGG